MILDFTHSKEDNQAAFNKWIDTKASETTFWFQFSTHFFIRGIQSKMALINSKGILLEFISDSWIFSCLNFFCSSVSFGNLAASKYQLKALISAS